MDRNAHTMDDRDYKKGEDDESIQMTLNVEEALKKGLGYWFIYYVQKRLKIFYKPW